MIVISGALVLMAAILLFIGLIGGSSLAAIYVSIGLSIVAAVFLWLGINQRPVEVTADGVGQDGSGRRARDPGRRQDEGERPSQDRQPSLSKQASEEQHKVPEQPGEVTDQLDVMSDDLVEDTDERTLAAALATGADVFVVSGHPRYHLEECPAVTGSDEAESLPIGEARELGFVPCGACQPDSEIAEASAAVPHTSNGSAAHAQAQSEPAGATGEPELVNAPPAVAAQAAVAMQPSAVAPPPDAQVPPLAPVAPQQSVAQVPAVAPPPTAYDPSATQPQVTQPSPAPQWQQPAQPEPQQWQQPVQPPAAQPPAAYQPPVEQPPPVAPPPVAPPVAAQAPVAAPPPVAAQPPVAAPQAAPAPPTTEPPAAPQPPASQQVVVLPGKARYHRPDCRLVSGPEATEALGKVDAVRQGYLACAICKP